MRVFVLVAAYSVLGVLIGVFTGEKVLFLAKEQLGLSAGALTNLRLFVALPAYCQALFGAGTESFRFLGSHRRSYFALAALLSAAVWLCLSALTHYLLGVMVCFLLLVGTAGTLRVVVFNAVAVGLGNRTGTYKHIQTIQTLAPLLLITAFAGHWEGLVTQRWSYHAAFVAAAVVSLAYIGLLPLIAEPDSVATSAGVTDFGAPRDSGRARLVQLREALRDRRFWAIIAFVAYCGLTPSPDTARVYFFTDVLHFSKILIGDLAAWGAGGSILGVVAAQFLPRHLRLRQLAVATAWTNLLAYFPMLIIHDPTSAKFAIAGNRVILTVSGIVYYWMWARSCPKGLEAAIYGALASTQTFFYLLCDWLGTHMYDWFGPASHHSAAHGWYWTIVACIVLSAPLIPMVLWLPRNDPADDPARTSHPPEPADGTSAAAV